MPNFTSQLNSVREPSQIFSCSFHSFSTRPFLPVLSMDESKKRKVEGDTRNGNGSEAEQQLRLLLDPLRKEQLVDLLAKLGTQYASVAEEIRGVARADPVHRKLFIRGLALETTSETLCAAFREHGEIEEGAVIVDKATGKSRGFGFVTYKHMESTQDALREPGKLIDGRMAVCALACEKVNSTSSIDIALRKLYIGGLSPDISSETLLKFFSRYGEIEEGSVAYDKETNKSRGFGFVTYKNVEAAKKAIDDPNKSLGGRNITVKLADSKNKLLQGQLPAAVVPIPNQFPAGYPQLGKSHVTSYSQSLSVANPSLYPNPPTQYLPQSHILYGSLAAKKDSIGYPAASSPGLSGFPYYVKGP